MIGKTLLWPKLFAGRVSGMDDEGYGCGPYGDDMTGGGEGIGDYYGGLHEFEHQDVPFYYDEQMGDGLHFGDGEGDGRIWA